ncbi:MAG: glycosyltransferase 87 family protein, partial [Pirellulales bacterium]
SPAQVLAVSRDAAVPPELATLVSLRDASPEMMEILRRVHFGELPTIYPPTSQAIFALASLITPDDASIWHRMVIFKVWFVAFDMATLALVVLLLRYVGRPVAWSLAYGWCPLLIKEVANSGHLDAVAVFFTTLAIYLIVRACYSAATWQEDCGTRRTRARRTTIVAALMLSLAIGAKLYPVVLVPLFLAVTRRQFGWRTALGVAVVALIATAVIMWPMVPKRELAELPEFRIPSASEDLPPLPPPHIGTEARDPSESLRAFLGEWEMNDFLFLLLMENIRPTVELPPEEVAWFSMVPESWRKLARRFAGKITGVEPSRTPFLLSRTMTSAALLALAIVLALQAGKRGTPAAFLEAAFLTVAWFWLILPTGNPWYWTWALPLLPFARGRAWLVLSGLVLVYYLRFWLVFHYPDPPVLGTRYNGALFFDYNVTWLEFGPWFAVLLLATLLRFRRCEHAQHKAAPTIATIQEAGSGTAVGSPPNKITKPVISSKSKSPS